VAVVNVLPLGDVAVAAPMPQQTDEPATATTRWGDIDGPSLGQADAEPVPVTRRSDDHPVVVDGYNIVDTEISADDVLAAVGAVSDDSTHRAGSNVRTPRVKVGIIGYFDTALLGRQIRAKQLPRIPADQRVCFSGSRRCSFGTPGARMSNLVATRLHSRGQAPTVDLYLAEAATLPAMRRAIQWMADRGVQVMVPLALVPWDDSGNGTGPAARLLAEAVDAGMFVVAAAGDSGRDSNYQLYNGSYLSTRWIDRDGDDWLEFRPGDESLGAYCGALYGMRWSDWGGRATDYDLYVSDATRTPDGIVDGNDRRLLSGRDQSRPGVEPLEANDFRWLCNSDPRRGPVYDTNGDNFVSLWVYRTDRSSEPANGDVIELMVLNGWLEHSVGRRNIQDPWAVARDPGVVTVGALIDSEIAWFTPSGPTNDRRQKPDIAVEGCLEVTARGRCSPEIDDPGDDVVQSTAIAAGGGAAFVAAAVGGYAPQTPQDLRFLLELMSRQWGEEEGVGSVGPRTGWGRPLYTRPPPDNTAQIGGPFCFVRVIRSPKGTAAQLERTFTTVTRSMVFGVSYMGDEELRPAPVMVTVTNARRAGVVQIWGRGQVPSDAVTVHFDKSKGEQSRTVVLRDVYGLWVRSTTGGEVTIRPAASALNDLSGYSAVTPGVAVRRASDGVVPAGTSFSDDAQAWSSLVDGSLFAAVTIVAPAADGVVRLDGKTVAEFDKGRSLTTYGVGAVWKRMSASVPVRVDVDVIGLTSDLGVKTWRRRATNETELTLTPGTDTVIDLGLSADGRRGHADALVHLETQSTARGSVSTVGADGRERRVLDHSSGPDTSFAIVRADRGKVTLRSTARVRLTINVHAHSIRSTEALDLDEPPVPLSRNLDVSDDGMVVASENSRNRLSVWDRRTNTVRHIDRDPGVDPDPNSTLLGVSTDGSAIAYSLAGTPAKIVVHDLATNDRDVYPLSVNTSVAPGFMASGNLTVFIQDPTTVWRVNGGALQRVVLTDWQVRDVDDSGTRLLADSPLALGPKIIDLDGDVVLSQGSTPAYLMSGDGRSVLNQRGQVYTDGALRWEACRGAENFQWWVAELDRTADHVVMHNDCGAGFTSYVHLFTPDGKRRVTTEPNSVGVISGDGSTLLLSNAALLVGALDLDG
jgi:hypothetical protein